MTSATLWIEITIAGAIYLLAALVWLLALFAPNVAIVNSLESVKECLPYLAVGFVAASYITGIIAHRIVQIIARPILRILERVIHLKDLTLDPGGTEDLIRIWQYGSGRLHRELDFQYALVALFRSLLFSVLLLGTGVIAWLCRMRLDGIWGVVGLIVGIWSLCFLAYRRQWQHHYNISRAATQALKPVERNALQSPRGPE